MMDELWHIDARRTVAVLLWLIRLAETTHDITGGHAAATWAQNTVLRQAIDNAAVDVASRCAEPDAFYADVHGEEAIDRLANAIATRLGEAPKAGWTSGRLESLSGRVMSC